VQQEAPAADDDDDDEDKETDKDKEDEVEIEYVTEEPQIYDPNFIFFKRIFEAFKVRRTSSFFTFFFINPPAHKGHKTLLVNKEDGLMRNAEWGIPPSRGDGEECTKCRHSGHAEY